MRAVLSFAHRRTLLILLAAVLVLVAGVCVASRLIVLGGFDNLEKVFLKRNIARSQEVVRDYVANIETKLADWAVWDDTYRFMEDKNEAYIHSNLVPTTFSNLKIDYILFVNASNEIVYSSGYDVQGESSIPVPPKLIQAVVDKKFAPLLLNEKSSVAGLFMLDRNPLLLAIRPVVTSAGFGPAHGYLLFAADLDNERLKYLGNIIRANLNVWNYDEAFLPNDFSRAHAAFKEGQPHFLLMQEKEVLGFSYLKDIFGKPAAILRVATPNEISSFGRNTYYLFLAALLGVGLLFGLAVFVPFSREIEGRQRAEESLKASQRLLEDIIEFLPDPTFVINKEKKVIAWNKAMEEMTQIPKKDMIGKGDGVYSVPFYGKVTPMIIDTILDYSRSVSDRYTVIERRGDSLYAEAFTPNLYGGKGAYCWGVASRLLDAKGNATGAIESIRDVSDRKQAEEILRLSKEAAEKANRAKSDFLSSISHEMRTPLHSIIGFSENVVQITHQEKVRTQAGAILHESELFLRLINDLLDQAKMETGKIGIEPQPFDLVLLLEEIKASFMPIISRRNIKFDISMAQDMGRYFVSDSYRVRQVLMNLVANAVKFTETGFVRVDVLPVGIEGRQQRVKFKVADSGIGIPEDKIKHIFSPFYQVDPGSHRKYGGTGLGMSISKQLVDLLNGTIGCESVLGEGSVFWFELPFGVCSREQVATLAHQNIGGVLPVLSPGVLSARVLFAEDQDINRELARVQFERLGFVSAVIVSDGLKALEACQKEKFDLVILDIQMPIMDGIEAAQQIRSLHGVYDTVPIVAATATMNVDILAQCKKARMNDVLLKPVRIRDLAVVLNKYLDVPSV